MINVSRLLRRKKVWLLAVVVILGVAGVGLSKGHQHKPASVTAPTQGYYVAMGDSVAAGVGLPDYADSSACDRTNQSYPKLVAASLHYELTDVACSGATTSAGLIGKQDVNKLLVAPQLDVLTANRKPELITITIGANDTQWTSFLQKCYTAECGSAADTAAVTAGIQTLSQNLTAALTRIAQLYPQAPPVVLTGYYQLFGQVSTTDCPELSGLDAGERQWIKTLQTDINRAIKSTAQKYAFTKYVEPNFQGHELCTADPWIQGLAAKAPYHPSETGQAAIADDIEASFRKGRQQ